MAQVLTEVRTPRLRLRPPRTSDAVRLAGLLDDFDVVRMTSNIPSPYRFEHAQDFLRAIEEGNHHAETFVVEHLEFDVIGVIGLNAASDARPRLGPELGYWLGRTFWGRGFATEAARALLTWAAQAGTRAMVSGHFADNPASGKVLSKAGFLYTGEVRHRLSLARGVEVPTRMMIWLA